MTYTWKFATKRNGDRGNGGEDTSLKMFRDWNTRCLIREFAQNSIDAPSNKPDMPPVEVHFSYVEIDGELKKQLVDSLLCRMVACKNACSRNSHSKNPYDKKIEYIESVKDQPIFCLKVSDYNTTGMEYFNEDLWETEEEYMSHKQPPFNSCVISNGASNKQRGHAGGSHGLGKNVGLEKSEVDAVYYSTMTEDVDEFGNPRESNTFAEGIIQLCDHRIFEGDEKGSYLKDGYFGSKEGSIPDEGDDIPVEFRRTEPGTDAYIIGVYKSETDIKELKQYMLRSFFAAIQNEVVVFNLFGEVFNKENLCDKVNEYFPIEEFSDYDKIYYNYKIEFNPRPYCIKALCTPKDNESFLERVADESKYPHLGECVFHIWKDESIVTNTRSKDTVLCMRNNGMVIEVRRLSTAKGLSGVVICGEKGGQFLRLMENVTHDEWSKGQLSDATPEDAALAKKVYSELDSFINDVVRELFPWDSTEEHDIKSLKRHVIGKLGESSSESDEGNWPSTNVSKDSKEGKKDATEKPSTLHARSKKKNTAAGLGANESSGDEGSDSTGGAGGNNGGGSSSGGSTNGPGGDEGNVGDGPNETSPEDGDDDNTDATDATGKHVREITLPAGSKFLMPCHDGEFAMKLAIKVPRDYSGCSLKFFIQQYSGVSPLELKRVSDGYSIDGVDNNEITGIELHKDSVNYIRFTPVEVIQNYTLIITAYGY